VTEGDRELLGEMARLFRRQSAELLGEIRAAVAAGDAVRLGRAAHTLKGSLATFGARAAADAAQRLEAVARGGSCAGAEAACGELEQALARVVPAVADLAAGGAR
jgi:HPt (histidine-containing phosphotransfer) domain-containing protein